MEVDGSAVYTESQMTLTLQAQMFLVHTRCVCLGSALLQTLKCRHTHHTSMHILNRTIVYGLVSFETKIIMFSYFCLRDNMFVYVNLSFK